jgi:hypothetical protein
MTPELEKLHESPPEEDTVLAEIGRTILAVQDTEGLFRFIARIVIPNEPPTLESIALMTSEKGAKTLGTIKKNLEDRGVKANSDLINNNNE